MKPAYRITKYQAVGDCPKNRQGIAYLWITTNKKWERLGVMFEAPTCEEAEAKAHAWWTKEMAKVAANKAKTGKGRDLDYAFAPDFFKALEGYSQAVREATEVVLSDLDGVDQRGYGLAPDDEEDEHR